MAQKVNYTPEMVKTITDMYAEVGNDGLDEIAKAVGKNVKSVRAKLVREGVYVAPEKTKAVLREDGPTKKEILADLEKSAIAAGAEIDVWGFESAKKDALAALDSFFRSLADPEGQPSTED